MSFSVLRITLFASSILILVLGKPFTLSTEKREQLGMLSDCERDWGHTSSKQYMHRVERTQECWQKGMVLRDTDFLCYKLNSQGPCGASQRIAYTKSVCPLTTCRLMTDDSNTPCLNNTISYQGNCVDPEDPAVCGMVKGRRLVADLFGEYSCQCAASLGFLELEGKCWPRYLQGPCSQGNQVAKNSDGKVLCREDSCASLPGQPLVLGPRDICYQLQWIFARFLLPNATQLFTQEERALFEEDKRIKNSSSFELNDPALRLPCGATHCTCKNVARTTGDCLEGVDIVPERFDEKVDFFALLTEFNTPTVNQIKAEIIVEDFALPV